MVKISPEWVTGPEQGKSSGRIASHGGGIPCENRVYHKKVRMTVGLDRL